MDQYCEGCQVTIYTIPLTSSTRKYETHDRKYRLQLSSFDDPHNGHDDDSESNQYRYYGKFLGP